MKFGIIELIEEIKLVVNNDGAKIVVNASKYNINKQVNKLRNRKWNR
jgi:hypothetical protein